ncbi:unnamed protein product [Musa acuminata subsp. burmannicoides]
MQIQSSWIPTMVGESTTGKGTHPPSTEMILVLSQLPLDTCLFSSSAYLSPSSGHCRFHSYSPHDGQDGGPRARSAEPILTRFHRSPATHTHRRDHHRPVIHQTRIRKGGLK